MAGSIVGRLVAVVTGHGYFNFRLPLNKHRSMKAGRLFRDSFASSALLSHSNNSSCFLQLMLEIPERWSRV